MVIQKKIKEQKDLEDIIGKIIENNQQAILVQDTDGNHVCGMFFSEKKLDWVCYFNMFKSFPITYDGLYHTFSFYSELVFIPLKDKYALAAAFRSVIQKNIYDDILGLNETLLNIMSDTKEYMFRPVMFEKNQYGILIGCSATMEDYYWIYLKPDGSIGASSCVGYFEELYVNDIPADLRHFVEYPNLKEICIRKKIEYFKDATEVEIV